MYGITVVVPFSPEPGFIEFVQTTAHSPLVERIIILHGGNRCGSMSKCEWLKADGLSSGKTINHLLAGVKTRYLLIVQDGHAIRLGARALERFVDAANITGAGIVYADHHEMQNGRRTEHPLNDYQPGSVRDDFDFGPLLFLSVPAIRKAIRKYGLINPAAHAGLYDLRLKVSIDHELFHLRECLYTKTVSDRQTEAATLFDYVDPRNRSVQKEREAVFTKYLKSIGAFLKPARKKVPPSIIPFSAEASVVIPVRNRRKTVADAVQSALSQKADFPFNVIVVDNHSTDGTTPILARLARKHPAVRHIIPERFDLGIGGCWNEAIYSNGCGRYAVQLDSDDLYSGPDSLQRIVDLFRQGSYAMVIGAYTLVDERLKTIPPGLIDHQEWTDGNGHNNALRINGLGAPRAFDTGIVRGIGFLNVSYGEDYAVSLRISREHRIGRIYNSLYLCRRWKDNTDASLSVEQRNRNDAFKDSVRTLEIMARRAMNKKSLVEK